MKYIKIMLCLMLFFILCKERVMAALAIEINREINNEIITVPTATPTSIIIFKPIKNIDIKPLSTNTPTPIVITQVVTATPNPTVSVAQAKPTETEKITAVPSLVKTVTPEPTIEVVEKTEKTDSNMWFWVVIAGFMDLILAIQIWSTKNNEKNQSKKEN